MPLYLVRGPQAWGALIRARNPDHLARLIDELDNPLECEFEEYTGPVCIQFGLPDVEDGVFEDESALEKIPTLGWFGETGEFMSAIVAERLFPLVHAERCRLAELVELEGYDWGSEAATALRTAVESESDRDIPQTQPFEDEEILDVLERGNDIHMGWLNSGWASCDPDLESLLDWLDEALDAGDVLAARRAALELRDAVRERA